MRRSVYIFIKGIATQTILTIPVSQQINSNEQLVQTLAAFNNCATNHQLQQQHQQQQQQQQSHQMQSVQQNPGLYRIYHTRWNAMWVVSVITHCVIY